MVRWVRILAVALGVPLVCAPLAILVTVLCAPLWEWFEAATAIQSYGHHGPVEWCYVVTFLALVGTACTLILIAEKQRRSRPGNSSKPTSLSGGA